MAHGWFHSADLVTTDGDEYVTVVDRIKDVINTGGVLVASREVRDEVYTHPAVAEVAVVGTPDGRQIEAITAVVVLKDDAAQPTAELLPRPHFGDRLQWSPPLVCMAAQSYLKVRPVSLTRCSGRDMTI
jgi:acyl-CoA synthetase (AMP-forming)/AMP-acid ligase II